MNISFGFINQPTNTSLCVFVCVHVTKLYMCMRVCACASMRAYV